MLVAHADDPVRMLREYLFGWWALFGDTEFGGVPKLMTSGGAELSRGGAVLRARGDLARQGADARGARSRCGQGRVSPDGQWWVTHILMAPLLHLALWRHSFAVCCQVPDMDPNAYLESFLIWC